MNFASDNWAGAHPQIAEALARHATGFAAAYGNSDLDKVVKAKFSEVFERDVDVFFVATGTAANSLAMTAFAKPGGVFFAHREAHMLVDECGAPEYLSGGGRLCPVDGPLGRMDPAQLDAAIRRYPAQFLHGGQPAGVSVTQSSEIGTVYSLDELGAIADVARSHKLPLHMDGARFANALVSLGCTPAEMTWKRGIDIVSFGGTKNGCWCAEALVVLNPESAPGMPFIHKRAAQLFSKSRFVSAQFEAYFADDLWLKSARHSNAMAKRLAELFEKAPGARLAWQPQANEVFAILRDDRANALAAAGARFYDWHAPHGADLKLRTGEVLFRFVTSFATTEQEVEKTFSIISRAS
ncbi:MAG: low specificity L-threonine aldolase [Rhizobiaceae bacterium]|nr:low specificity L-threonine aldolase [Rhizobiaceae bacterium]